MKIDEDKIVSMILLAVMISLATCLVVLVGTITWRLL
jgi:hypothetical protein